MREAYAAYVGVVEEREGAAMEPTEDKCGTLRDRRIPSVIPCCGTLGKKPSPMELLCKRPGALTVVRGHRGPAQ